MPGMVKRPTAAGQAIIEEVSKRLAGVRCKHATVAKHKCGVPWCERGCKLLNRCLFAGLLDEVPAGAAACETLQCDCPQLRVTPKAALSRGLLHWVAPE
jgi:hypothetical protein